MPSSIKIGIIFIALLAFMNLAYAWNDYAESNSTISGRKELITYGSQIYEESDYWLLDYKAGSLANGTDFNISLANSSVITKQDFNGKQFRINVSSSNSTNESLTISICNIPNYEINETYEQYSNEWLYSFDGVNWSSSNESFYYSFTPAYTVGCEEITCRSTSNTRNRCSTGCSCPGGTLLTSCSGQYESCDGDTITVSKRGVGTITNDCSYPSSESYNIWDSHESIFVKKSLYGNVNLALNVDGKTECEVDGAFTNSTNLTRYFNKTVNSHTAECNITRTADYSSFDVEDALVLPRWTEKNCTDIYIVPSNSSGELVITLFPAEDNLSHVYYEGENVSSYNISDNTRIAISGYGTFQSPQWQNQTIEEPEVVVQEALPEPPEEKPKSGGSRRRRPPVYLPPPEPIVNLTVSVVEPPQENNSVAENSTAPPLTPIIKEKVEEITKPKSKKGYVILAGLMLPLIFNGASIYRKIKRSSKGMKVEIPE